MDREVLYRGKREDNGEWVVGYYFYLRESALDRKAHFIVTNDGFGFSWHKVIPETVGQFFGEPDSNGTKIFEGDIVEARLSHHGAYIARGVVWFGEFEGLNENKYVGFYVEWLDEYATDYRKSIKLWLTERHLEVIGNKWDNPDLLEVK